MVIHMRYIDVGGYRYNYEGFYEKSTYQMSINRVRMITTQGAHTTIVRILSFLLSLSLLVKSFEEEIQPFRDYVDNARG